MKKLITVCWSNTVEVEVPDEFREADGLYLKELLSFAGALEHIGDAAIFEASNNISAKSGEITDVQDA